MGRAGLRNSVHALAWHAHLPWHLGTGALPVALPAGSRRDGCPAHDARMVSACRRAGSDVPAHFFLAAVALELSVVRRRRRLAFGASRFLRPADFLCALCSVPRRADQAAPGDGLSAPPPAVGPAVRSLAAWLDHLAPAGRRRHGAATA